MGKHSPYLHDIPLEEAIERLSNALDKSGIAGVLSEEAVGLDHAVGRVTAEPVWAVRSSPHYHSAAMDGYAVRSRDIQGITDRSPTVLKIDDGASYVDTGDPLPGWADAVVPKEDVEVVGEPDEAGRAREAIIVRAGGTPWMHVRLMGEDIVATELIVPAGQALRPPDIGAIAAAGHTSVVVSRKPSVAILPTGSELVELESNPKPGQIPEFNSLILQAQVESWGGTASRLPMVRDDFDLIRKAVAEACEDHDLVLVIAGSSAGSEDYTAEVVESLGKLLVHGVAVRPGHPVIIGVAEEVGDKGATPIIGIPGYPVSATLTGEIFVEPLLARWLGRHPTEPIIVDAELARKVHSTMGDDEYLRVTLGEVSGRLTASPLRRGAGMITSLVRADGIVIIPTGTQGLQAGEEVAVRLYRSLAEINRTIVAQGSHDLTLDMISQSLGVRGSRLASSNVGSLGGLIALRKGHAHIAGCHLLDSESGEYNKPFVEKYLSDRSVFLIGLVNREQGLIINSGNPKRISGLEDLVREDVCFVNRQRGSGTRVLLDYQLNRLDIETNLVRGYDREEYTHMAIAADIASGTADAGLGIYAAAVALHLDFIPLFDERYDLAIPAEHFNSKKLEPLFELLQNPLFRADVERMPGYSAPSMGSILAVVGPASPGDNMGAQARDVTCEN